MKNHIFQDNCMSLLSQLTLINLSSYHTKWQDNSWHWLSLPSVSSFLPPLRISQWDGGHFARRSSGNGQLDNSDKWLLTWRFAQSKKVKLKCLQNSEYCTNVDIEDIQSLFPPSYQAVRLSLS